MLELKLLERERDVLLRILVSRVPPNQDDRTDEEQAILEKVRKLPYKEHRA